MRTVLEVKDLKVGDYVKGLTTAQGQTLEVIGAYETLVILKDGNGGEHPLNNQGLLGFEGKVYEAPKKEEVSTEAKA